PTGEGSEGALPCTYVGDSIRRRVGRQKAAGTSATLKRRDPHYRARGALSPPQEEKPGSECNFATQVEVTSRRKGAGHIRRRGAKLHSDPGFSSRRLVHKRLGARCLPRTVA